MEWLNFHHLHYFWVVAREGTISRAAEELRLAPSTISEQIGRLEESLGVSLFRRVGRNNVLTNSGQIVFRYAEEIFGLGRELVEYVRGRQVERLHLRVGLSMVVPKQVAARLLEPALKLEAQPVHLVCREAPTDALMADLAQHRLDIVITDAPLRPDSRIRAFNHVLAECGICIMGTPQLAACLREGFPASLDGAPFLVPTRETVVRRLLDHWFDGLEVNPLIVAEADDNALLKVFARRGHGVLAVPQLVQDEVAQQYGLEPIGVVEGVTERFYAVSVQRQLRHPAVVAIANALTPE